MGVGRKIAAAGMLTLLGVTGQVMGKPSNRLGRQPHILVVSVSDFSFVTNRPAIVAAVERVSTQLGTPGELPQIKDLLPACSGNKHIRQARKQLLNHFGSDESRSMHQQLWDLYRHSDAIAAAADKLYHIVADRQTATFAKRFLRIYNNDIAVRQFVQNACDQQQASQAAPFLLGLSQLCANNKELTRLVSSAHSRAWLERNQALLQELMALCLSDEQVGKALRLAVSQLLGEQNRLELTNLGQACTEADAFMSPTDRKKHGPLERLWHIYFRNGCRKNGECVIALDLAALGVTDPDELLSLLRAFSEDLPIDVTLTSNHKRFLKQRRLLPVIRENPSAPMFEF